MRSLKRLAESKSSPKLHQSQGKNPSKQKATWPLGESPQNLVLLSYRSLLSVLRTEWDCRTNRWGVFQPLKVTFMTENRFCEGMPLVPNCYFQGGKWEYSEAFDDMWLSALEKVSKREACGKHLWPDTLLKAGAWWCPQSIFWSLNKEWSSLHHLLALVHTLSLQPSEIKSRRKILSTIPLNAWCIWNDDFITVLISTSNKPI